jgi:hypothetical protein
VDGTDDEMNKSRDDISGKLIHFIPTTNEYSIPTNQDINSG